MAISVVSSGSNTTADSSASTNSQDLTIASGTNRRLFAFVGLEGAADPPETVSGVTCGGVSLTAVSDGTDSATSQLSVGRVQWFSLLDASFPATGTRALVATLSGNRQCTVGYVILDDCDQTANVADAVGFNTSSTVTSLAQNVTVSAGAAVLAGAYTNELVISGPTFQAVGTMAEGTGAINVAWPTHQAGDIGLLFVESANQAVATPSTWNAITNGSQGIGTAAGTTATRLQVFWKRAASGAEGVAAVADSGDHTHGVIATFRGCIATGDPVDASAGSATTDANSTAIAWPAVTTTVANTLVVLGVSNQTDTDTDGQVGTVTHAGLASITERFDQNDATQSNGGGIAIITGTRAATGSTGTGSATLTTSSRQGRVVVALKPPIPTGVPDTATIAGGATTEHWEAYNNQGGSYVSGYSKILTSETGTQSVSLAFTSTNRVVAAALVVAEASLPEVDVSGALTMPAPAVAGTPAVLVGVSGAITMPAPAVAGVPTVAVDVSGSPPVFVSLTDGANNRSVTVPAGSNRLLVVAIYGNGMSACSGTYAGIALEVATTGNGSIQILWLIEPPVGAATLAISGATPDHIIAAHYTSAKRAFAAGQTLGSVASLVFPLANFLLMAGCESDGLADVFPGTNTIERFDDGNDGYGDKIPPHAALVLASVSIGWQPSVSPNFAAAAFHPAGPTMPAMVIVGTIEVIGEVDVGGALTMPAPEISGAPTVDIAVSGTLAMPTPVVAGTPAVLVALTGALSMPAPAVAGSPAVLVAVSGTLTMPAPGVAGNATTTVEVDVAGSLTMPVPALGGAFSVLVDVSGALGMSLPALAAEFSILVSVSGALSMPAPEFDGAAFPVVQVDVSGTLVMPAMTLGGNIGILIDVSGSLSMSAMVIAGGTVTPDFPGLVTARVTRAPAIVSFTRATITVEVTSA